MQDEMIRVMTIFGTRPEAIKMAPVIMELKKRECIECIVCVTAQHREMLDNVLCEFNIKPNYDLDIMKQGQSLAEITSKTLLGLENIMKREKLDLVLVHGDTTTTFAGALAAFYHKIPVAHIEAGLRTWDKYSPYPEELNRQMVSNIADIHFSPTEVCKDNLIVEGKNKEKIYVTGNTVIDALKTTVKKDYTNKILDGCNQKSRIILLTTHRRENIGEPMENIFRAIKRVVETFKDVIVIYPMHKNPLIRGIAMKIIGDNERIKLIEPLDVFDFHNFINRSYLIMTDSGGIQEEAPYLKKPVLVLRNTTERTEGVISGTLALVGTDEENIYLKTKELLTDKRIYEKMANAKNPYGDGLASEKIVNQIIKCF